MNIEGVEECLQLLRDGKTLSVIPKGDDKPFRFLYMDGDEYVVVDTILDNDFVKVKSILVLEGWLSQMIEGADWQITNDRPKPTGKDVGGFLLKYIEYAERFEAGADLRLKFDLPTDIKCEYQFNPSPPSYSVMVNGVLVKNVIAQSHYEVWLAFRRFLRSFLIEVEDA